MKSETFRKTFFHVRLNGPIKFVTTNQIRSGAWAELKSDNVIVLAVPISPVFSQFLSYQLAVIPVFRITSGFPGTSGSPEVTSPGP